MIPSPAPAARGMRAARRRVTGTPRMPGHGPEAPWKRWKHGRDATICAGPRSDLAGADAMIQGGQAGPESDGKIGSKKLFI
jgi:hypothetical protein